MTFGISSLRQIADPSLAKGALYLVDKGLES